MINKFILFLKSIFKNNQELPTPSSISSPSQPEKKKEKTISAQGVIFEGAFIDGHLEGEGKIQFPDGEVQIGRFEKGKLVEGSIVFPDGEMQQGQFVNGRLQGFSEVIFADGERQSGNFVLGKLHGEGKIVFTSGFIHEGYFVHGTLHGKGTLTRPDGSIFTSYFTEGVASGKGMITLSDGMEVSGAFNNGKFETAQGVGIISDEFSSSQLAEAASEIDADIGFSEEQLLVTFPAPQCETTLEHKELEGLPLGLLLSGSLENGFLHGTGKVIFPSGKLIHGKFNCGFMEGYAVVILPDGTVRQGEYKNNLLHGLGEVIFPTGTSIKGVFNQGRLVAETR